MELTVKNERGCELGGRKKGTRTNKKEKEEKRQSKCAV
jgi:hypothetical protein